MAAVWLEEGIRFPPRAVRFPVELRQPPGFNPEAPTTWPNVDGRLEFVGGRLLYMPPCGYEQGAGAVGVVGTLFNWASEHPDYALLGNEIGMIFGSDVRGAEAAVWHRADLPGPSSKYLRVPPILAVEVAGQDEDEQDLREKAHWYLARGVQVVWAVLPQPREVSVFVPGGESRHRSGGKLPEHPALPGLQPEVAAFFTQLDRK